MIAMLIVAVIAMALDQISKIIVTNSMELYQDIPVIKNFFTFFYCRNDGIAWGLDVKLWILILITIIAIGVFVYLCKGSKWKTDKWYIITLGMMLGGTLGNFIDRIFQADHSVIDFLNFYLWYPTFKNGWDFYDFPVFNVADSFLVVGAIMFIIYFLILQPKKEKAKKELENSNVQENVEIVDVNEDGKN